MTNTIADFWHKLRKRVKVSSLTNSDLTRSFSFTHEILTEECEFSFIMTTLKLKMHNEEITPHTALIRQFHCVTIIHHTFLGKNMICQM